ncbi:phage tail tape measure protein [uncultured Pseudomonas sp.]|uniref:phage tail tape measure protein n=1 Tax=uncultured Pseudomonas sp. TaxID=114707 RepID=UPI0025ED9551|nr:phage tail tape measure protein [uncultured Pseudomonas sp.]
MANDLQIRVLLSALDRVTAPLKRIAGGSSATARALKEARDRVKDLNQQQQDITGYQRQREAVRQSAEALAKGQEKLRGYREQLRGMDAPSAAFQKRFANVAAEVDRLQAKHTAQRTELQRLLPILRNAGVDTRNLGGAQARLETQLTQANAAIDVQKAKLTALNRLQERQAAVRGQLKRGQEFAGNAAVAGASSAATGAALGGPIIGMIKNYASFEDAMAGVAKQVEGARDDNGQLTQTYHVMARSIKEMAQDIPMATTEIAALVEGAARMGIQGKDDLLTFARTAATASTAYDLPAEQIGEDLARIAGLYKLPIKDVSALGDAINYLDDNAQSKGGDIIDVLKRTAGITASVGMNYKDAAALGSTFLSLGSSAEVAGTATNAMIRELAIAEQQPKRFGKALKVLGLDASKIQKGMAKDATGTIQMVLTAINKLPQDQQIGITTELFGKEYGDDAAKLANNMQEYQHQLDLVRGGKGAGSMQREGDIKKDQLSARWQMSQNRLFNLSSDLGETLRPTLVELLDVFNGIIEKVNAWAQANPKLIGTLLKIAAGASAISIAFGTLALGLAGVLGPFLALRFMLAQIGIRLPNLFGLLWSLGKRALPLVAAGFRMIGAAIVANPIGAILLTLLTAATLIYAYWDKIGPWFAGLWSELKTRASGGISGIAGIILDFSPIGLFYRAFAAVLNYFGLELPTRLTDLGAVLLNGLQSGVGTSLTNIAKALMDFSPLGLLYQGFSTVLNYFGLELPTKFTEAGAMLMDGLVTGITSRLTAAKDAIMSVGDSVIKWFRQKLDINSPSRVFATLGDFVMQGLAVGLAKGEDGPLAQIAGTAKQLASAGAVALGIGTAATPALANGVTFDDRPPLAASAAPVPAGGDTYHITINAPANVDAQQIARLVRAELAREKAEQAARSRSSLRDRT